MVKVQFSLVLQVLDLLIPVEVEKETARTRVLLHALHYPKTFVVKVKCLV